MKIWRQYVVVKEDNKMAKSKEEVTVVEAEVVDTPKKASIPWGSMLSPDGVMVEAPSKRRGRPPKKIIENDNTPAPVTNNYIQSNRPYVDSYNETQNLLKGAIIQIDMLANDVKMEMDQIKNSRVLKGKYKYMSDLAMTQSGLISNKIAAIREMNKTITDTHNLELKRVKDLRIDNTVDDDKKMMDLYNAFIKTPVSAGMMSSNALGPSIMDISMPQNNTNIARTNIGSEDAAYNSYIQNMTPEQKRMQLERDPNVKTVVVYDQGTGNRYFDVINTSTGQSIPGVSRPDNFLLENMSINLRSATARNSDANLDFPLVVVGSAGGLDV